MIEGRISVEGIEYIWTSPTLANLEEFETQVGPITDVGKVNSVRGRASLAYLCLKERRPELTLGVVRGWRAGVWPALWSMIKQAIPLFDEEGEAAKQRDEVLPPAAAPADALDLASPGPPQPASATASSPPSSDTPDGHLPTPDESA